MTRCVSALFIYFPIKKLHGVKSYLSGKQIPTIMRETEV